MSTSSKNVCLSTFTWVFCGILVSWNVVFRIFYNAKINAGRGTDLFKIKIHIHTMQLPPLTNVNYRSVTCTCIYNLVIDSLLCCVLFWKRWQNLLSCPSVIKISWGQENKCVYLRLPYLPYFSVFPSTFYCYFFVKCH